MSHDVEPFGQYRDDYEDTLREQRNRQAKYELLRVTNISKGETVYVATFHAEPNNAWEAAEATGLMQDFKTYRLREVL